DRPRPKLVATAYSAEGGLTLRKLGSREEVNLVSAGHEYRWLFDKRHRGAMPMVTLDVGNTSAKIARFDGDTVRTAVIADDDAWLDLLSGLQAGWPIFAVTVNEP